MKYQKQATVNHDLCPECGAILPVFKMSEDGGSGMPESKFCDHCGWGAE